MAIVLHDAYMMIALVFLMGAFTINSNDPRVEAVGWLLQGTIAIIVAWGVKRIGTNNAKLAEVHTLVNSRSAAQDNKIAALESKVDALLGQLGTARETLASERATAVTSQAVVDVAAATEPTKGTP
jgi:hypothetical protein